MLVHLSSVVIRRSTANEFDLWKSRC